MSVAKVSEITASSKVSFDDAVKVGTESLQAVSGLTTVARRRSPDRPRPGPPGFSSNFPGCLLHPRQSHQVHPDLALAG